MNDNTVLLVPGTVWLYVFNETKQKLDILEGELRGFIGADRFFDESSRVLSAKFYGFLDSSQSKFTMLVSRAEKTIDIYTDYLSGETTYSVWLKERNDEYAKGLIRNHFAAEFCELNYRMEEVSTSLKFLDKHEDLDTSQLHYVKALEAEVVLDLDIPDKAYRFIQNHEEDGNNSHGIHLYYERPENE